MHAYVHVHMFAELA